MADQSKGYKLGELLRDIANPPTTTVSSVANSSSPTFDPSSGGLASLTSTSYSGALGALSSLLSSTRAVVRGAWFNKKAINLDGYSFIDCRFDYCKIETTKGTFSIENCFFSNCDYAFEGEAVKVVKLFNWLGMQDDERFQPTETADDTINIKD